MINTLTLTPSTSYPLFSPDQVLSNRDLNRVVTYLESQNRLSRNHFMGMGIAFGLVPNAAYSAGNAAITISSGTGITSEGYVVSLPQKLTLTHYQNPQKIAASRFQVSSDTVASDSTIPNSTASNGTAPDSTVTVAEMPVLYTVTELFEGTDENPNRQPLHKIVSPQNENAFQQLLAEHVLIILCEQKDTTRDNYLLDCDDLGRDRTFILRYFLLPKNNINTDPKTYLSAEQLLNNGYAPDTLPEPWKPLSVPEIFRLRQSFFQRYRIQVPRFGVDTTASGEPSEASSDTSETDSSAGDAFSFENYAAFIEYYRTLCEQTIEQIRQVLPHVVEIFSPFFSSLQPPSDELADVGNRLTAKLANIKVNSTASDSANAAAWEASYTIQYFYDYLVQIVAAYDELVHSAFDLMEDCLPDIRRFPKFLMLGQVPVVPSDDSASGGSTSDDALPWSNTDNPYRSHFVQPPLYNQNHQRRREVRYLYDRLAHLCTTDNFAPLPFYAAPVHITPSCDRTTPLSKQAIPYYLNYAKLYPIWNYDADRKGVSARQPAYFLPKPDSDAADGPPAARDDLRFRLDNYNFYRIEGHLGKDKATMLRQLRQYQQRWNLAFDIVTLKIGSDIDPDDGDAIDDLNQSRRLEAIKQDFEGMTSLFQMLWRIYEEDWSRNTFLVTLKHVFFDRSGFSDISLSQLYNPVLEIARSDANRQRFTYQEVLDNNQPTGRYRLEISKANGDRLATVVFKREADSTVVDTLDLSGRAGSTLEDEKARIIDEISTALVAESVTYGVAGSRDLNSETATGATNEFFVTLSLVDAIALPVDPPGNPLRQVQVIVVFEDSFTVDAQSENLPLVQQSSFQDYETLYGLLRDIPDGYANERELSFQMGNRSAALDYIQAFHLPERIEAYRTSEGQIVAPQLFKLHPGMKHLGGVPEGGTFILAYADDPTIASELLDVRRSPDYQRRVEGIAKATVLPGGGPQELEQVRQQFGDWKNIVVADYCLPYRVGDNNHKDGQSTFHGSKINFPPIILLEKTSFCADDEAAYEFFLYPQNGQLKGEGSFFANGKYRFQPTRVGPDFQHDVAIAFTYAVDGCESSLVILVSPHPETRFLIGKSDKSTFCTTDDAIALIPCFGRGTFTAWDGDREISSEGMIEDNRLFQPAQVNLGEADMKEITLRHRISNEQETCFDETERPVTIHRQPSVNFQFGTGDGDTGEEGSDDAFRVCADVATLELLGTPANGVFRVLDGNHDISRRLLRGDRLLPSAFNLADAEDKTIQVEYSVVDENGCMNEITKALTILALPDADFQIGEGGNQTLILKGSDRVKLVPNTPGGSFQATLEGDDVTSNVIETQSDEFFFITENIDLEQAQQQVTLVYLASNTNDCSQQSSQTVTVVAPPAADFQIGNPEKTEFLVDDSPISLIPELSGGQFTAFDGDNEITTDVIEPEQRQFFPSKVKFETDAPKTIKLRHKVALLGFTNESEQEVTVSKRSDEPDEGGAPPAPPSDSETPDLEPGNRNDGTSPSESDNPVSDNPVPILETREDVPPLTPINQVVLAIPLVEENPSDASSDVSSPIQRDDASTAITEAFQLSGSPQTVSPRSSSVRSQENSAVDLSSVNEEINLLRDLSSSPRSVPKSVPRSVPRTAAFSEPDVLPESASHLASSLEGNRADNEADIETIASLQSTRDSPSLDPAFLSKIRRHLTHSLASFSNRKVAWTAAAGAIATIIIIMWAGIASNRSEPSTSTSNTSGQPVMSSRSPL